MPVSKAQIAATGKYEKTAYDKILLRIEKESDVIADQTTDETKKDGRRKRVNRNNDFPTKAQIEEAAARADESLNGYILGAVKQRIQQEAPDILSPSGAPKRDPLQEVADAIDGSSLLADGGCEPPKDKEQQPISNDPLINDI